VNSPPCSWLVEHAQLIQRPGVALDLACGRGRHALWLAAHGLSVTAIDRDLDALAHLQRLATSHGLVVTTRSQDLERGEVSLGTNTFDAIVVVHYLHRPLFPALVDALRPGGFLVYETFTRAQATIGKPTNPAFLLEPGELNRLVQSLDTLDAREGFFDARHVASVVARKRTRRD
jgi:SAM-dependent methyltransferase